MRGGRDAKSMCRLPLAVVNRLQGRELQPRDIWAKGASDHLAIIALSVGRAKDLTRILALLESGSVSREAIKSLAARHDLADAW